MSVAFKTGQECVLDLLRYIGVTGFSAISGDQSLLRNSADADDVGRAISALNSALQTIQKWGPQDLKYGERSARFLAPSTLTITALAEGALTMTATAPPAVSLGCSILIGGDADRNRIMGINGTTLTLLRSYRGATIASPITGTIYYDCAQLPTDVRAVLEPVAGSPNLKLWPAVDLDHFNRFTQRFWYEYGSSLIDTPNTPLGVPSQYYIETWTDRKLFMRLTPLPGMLFNATFQAKLRAERVAATICDLNGGTDPSYQFTSVDVDDVESILLPIARWRFFAHPSLKNSSAAPIVQAEYTEVMNMLKSGTVLESSAKAIRAKYI